MTAAGSVASIYHHPAGDQLRIASTDLNVAQVLIGNAGTIYHTSLFCVAMPKHAALLARAAQDVGRTQPDSARDLPVQLETLREHAWRILLD
jgi:hypothetical protein